MPNTNTIESLSQLERRLTMAVPVADIERQVDERLKKLARSVRMPGFRPGKVPLKIVAQQYGPQVRSEVTGDAVQKAFTEAVRDQNLRIAGYPRIERKEGAAEGELQFSATFEVYPEVGLGDLAGATIERPTLAVGDPEVDQTDRGAAQAAHPLRRGRARGRGGRPRDGRLHRDDRRRSSSPAGKGADFAFVLGEGRMLPEFEAGVTGLAAGDERTVAVTFPADYQSKEVAGKTATFAIRLKRVEAASAAGGRRAVRAIARGG